MTKGVMQWQSNNIDYTVVTSYRVISFLNYLSKVREKMAANILADWYKVYDILHEREMES